MARGKPTRIANANRDFRQKIENLPVSESIGSKVFGFERFVHFRPDQIGEYANAFVKVAENYGELLENDAGNSDELGAWSSAIGVKN